MKKIQNLRLYNVISHCKDVLDAAPRLIEHLSTFQGKFTPLNLAALGISAVTSAIDFAYDRLELSTWPVFFGDDVPDIVKDIVISALINHKSHHTIKLNRNVSYNPAIHFVELKGTCLAWYEPAEPEMPIHKIYFDGNDKERLLETINEIVWTSFSSNILCAERETRENNKLKLRAWNSLDASIITTPVILALMERLSVFMKHEIKRSYALKGPPGTGKSIAAMAAISGLNMRCLKLPVNTLGVNEADITRIISVLKPDIVVIDDIDWASSHSPLLYELESMRQLVKAIIVTLNSSDELPKPLLRPGRIDDVIEFNEPPDEVVTRIIGKDDKNYDAIKAWPIAFITEYKTLRDVLGLEEASEAIASLQERVDNQDNS